MKSAALPLSRYFPDVMDFAMRTKAKAAYCFVVDGDKGTGGCPVIVGLPETREEYLARNRELVQLLRRSADMLEKDIGNQ